MFFGKAPAFWTLLSSMGIGKLERSSEVAYM